MGSTNDIPTELPEPAPPDFPQNDIKKNENGDNAISPTKTKANDKTIPGSKKKNTITQPAKSVVITPQDDLPTLKTPVEIDDVDTNTSPASLLIQITIEVASTAVIINNRITTPATLQIRPKNGKSSIEIAQVHLNIFHAMQIIDPTLKIITFQNESIDTFDHFSIDEKAYTETFKEINKDSKTSRVYISFKIESSKHMSEIKHGSSTNVSNIFKTLVDNNEFIYLNKYSYHRKHSIGFFANISSTFTIRENLRKSIQDQLIWIDIDDKENESLVKKGDRKG